GQDLMTAFSASLASVSNIGPGFGQVGSMANYFEIDGASKLVLSIGMLLGRLEIYGLLLLFMFHSWK
ncbi:MAG TPA: potassium transporter TrkG, partial [Tenuifilaceae bacterium]|nr:potassium transporter TrkG [Tenuifilaceae bacterium]